MPDNVSDKDGISRRTLLKGAGAIATSHLIPSALASPTAQNESAAAHPPFTAPEKLPDGYNILLITSDQERYFEHYPFPVPGRERLMKTGTTFARHYINSCVCTSSRSVMYTGLHMPQTRMFDNVGLPWMPWSLDPKLGTVASMIDKLGYYAAYKGKWHLSRPLELSLKDVPSKDIDDIDHAPLHQDMQQYGFQDYSGIGDLIGLRKGGYVYDSLTLAQSVSWLRSKGRNMSDSQRPWLLAVNLVNPHDVMFIDTDAPGERIQWHSKLNENQPMSPSQPPENALYAARWDRVPLPASRHQPFEQSGRPAAQLNYQQARAMLVGQFPDEDRRWRKLQDYYFNCIRDNDTHVVALLNELDALGLTEKTIVVMTSDHGELQGFHQMHGKGTCVYQQQVQVPMIISHPAYPGGKVCNALTSHLDLTPTLLGLTGKPAEQIAPLLHDRKGKDFSALIKDPEQASLHQIRDASLYCYDMMLYIDDNYLRKVFDVRDNPNLNTAEKQKQIQRLAPDYHRRSGVRMLFDGRYKFARYYSLRQHNMPENWEQLLAMNDLELYDLGSDPQEMNNLAREPEQHRDLIMAMNQKLNARYRQEIGEDDGSFLPDSQAHSWHLDSAHFEKMIQD
ncbi:sulfatase-like hydrolase/transferase [Pantoea coffeiphila]|uniref:sulfatase-like hydrolase/transferase n=1 Tax=Pantoea coffeiphila TaxID=1465635 RepID=UPI001960BC7B|nr:sulfatase-like hydrolase/transferase [Pantoea coffeiphila]MBM7343553.1 arylsulfatase A-like enzyme [Pantoea coffeiphila]